MISKAWFLDEIKEKFTLMGWRLDEKQLAAIYVRIGNDYEGADLRSALKNMETAERFSTAKLFMEMNSARAVRREREAFSTAQRGEREAHSFWEKPKDDYGKACLGLIKKMPLITIGEFLAGIRVLELPSLPQWEAKYKGKNLDAPFVPHPLQADFISNGRPDSNNGGGMTSPSGDVSGDVSMATDFIPPLSENEEAF